MKCIQTVCSKATQSGLFSRSWCEKTSINSTGKTFLCIHSLLFSIIKRTAAGVFLLCAFSLSLSRQTEISLNVINFYDCSISTRLLCSVWLWGNSKSNSHVFLSAICFFTSKSTPAFFRQLSRQIECWEQITHAGDRNKLAQQVLNELCHDFLFN